MNNINNKYYKYKKNRQKMTIQELNEVGQMEKNINVVLIIPHRNRLDHLKLFIDNLSELSIDSTNQLDIYLIDQNNGDRFNRGLLLNIGYILAKKQKKYVRYIFHDVDIYPNQEILNSYFADIDKNIHYTTSYSQTKYNFDTYFGGVSGFNSESFDKINGFPNNLFGWGGEDDCLYNRSVINKLKIYKYTKKRSYNLPEHEKPSQTEINNKKKINILEDLKNWSSNGIKQFNNLFINVKQISNYEKFLSTYETDLSNDDLESKLIYNFNPIIDKSNEKNYYWFKIDYLAKHTLNGSKIMDRTIIQTHINKKIEKLKKLGVEKYYQHPLNPIYISAIEPLIYWSEIEEKIISTYEAPEKFIDKNIETNTISELSNEIKNLVNDKFLNYWSIYENTSHNLTITDLTNTLKHIFDTYGEILYFRIRNSELVMSYHLYNAHTNINWYKDVIFKNNNVNMPVIETYQQIIDMSQQSYITLRKPNTSKPNNCLVDFESHYYLNGNPISYVNGYKNMLEYMIKCLKIVPDADILINRKDFAFLDSTNLYAYDHLVKKNDTLNFTLPKYWMIGSQSTKKNNLDIQIPSSDEWTTIISMSKSEKINSEQNQIKWSDKQPIAFFRGSSTGCSTKININPRLKLCQLSFEWSKISDKKNLLNVSLSSLAHRIKSYNGQIEIPSKYNKMKYLLGNFVPYEKQLEYKYTFNIEGNAQAYRYPNEFKKNTVILNVKSKYHMWFEQLLVPDRDYIEIDPSYENLFQIIKNLKSNDEMAKQIALNGYNFANKYINKKVIAVYWFFYLYWTNHYTHNMN